MLRYLGYVLFCVVIFYSNNHQVFGQSCTCTAFTPEFKQAHEAFFKQQKFDSALALTRQLDVEGKCCAPVSHILKANNFLGMRAVDSAQVHVLEAQRLLGKNYDTLVSPEILRIQGQLAQNNTTPEKAAEFYLKGLDQSMQHKNIQYAIIFCNDLSKTFASINQPEKSLEYMRKGANMSVEYGDLNLSSMMFANLGVCFGMLFENTKDPKWMDSLERNTPIAIDYAKRANNLMYMVRGYNTLAGMSVDKQQFEKALAYTDTVMMMLPPKGGEQLLLSAKYRKAQAYLGLHKPEPAMPLLQEALELAGLLKNAAISSLITQQLYLANRDMGNADEALKYYEQHITIRDSLQNLEKSATINELEQKYNKAENERTIKELSQEKEISTLKIRFLIAGILAMVLIAISIYLFYRQKHLRNKQLIMETEQRLNRARMNPHFFFNALASLQGFALRENDGRALASNLSKFSHIMRETLESTYKDYVTIEQEMQFLTEYLELQKMRFPHAFNFRMSAAALEEPDQLLIPSMIIQPFVENSIEHGFKGISYPGEIDILFDEDETHVVVSILDNGKGLGGPESVNNEHISRASQIIRDRIYLLNLKLKSDASFSIANQSEGQGVLVKIRLPKMFMHESVNN